MASVDPASPPSSPNRTKEGLETERRMLDVAAALFRAGGYEGTSIRDLARAMGISPASLYHYIGGKEELLFSISVTSLNAITRAVSEAVETVESPLERMRTMIVEHTKAALGDRDMHATMLIDMRSLSGAHREQVVALRAEYESYVRGLVAQAQRDGVLRGEISAKYLSRLLLNLLNWSIFWFVPDAEISSEVLGNYAADIFLSGVATDGYHDRG